MTWVIVLVMVSAAIVGWLVYYFTRTLERRAEIDAELARRGERDRERRRRKGKLVDRRPISSAGVKAQGGGLACPQCGGTQFQAKRSKGAKMLLIPTVGVGALLARKTRVKCITCGTEYLRG